MKMTPEQIGRLGASMYKLGKGVPDCHACNCIGPQNGEPLCPCQMRSVQIVNGRYVRTQDIGPAPQQEPRP